MNSNDKLCVGVGILTVVLFIILSLAVQTSNGIDPSLGFINRAPINNETYNLTLLSPVGGIAQIPLEKGKYHIRAETAVRGVSFSAGFQYNLNEEIVDRFGRKDNYIQYGWKSPESQDYGYLGITDDNTVIDTTFEIPSNATKARLLFVIHSNGYNRISITKL